MDSDIPAAEREAKRRGQSQIFASPGYYGRELEATEVPLVQALFDANPEYFLSLHGRPPNADEAEVEYAEFPPAHLPFTRRWFTGLFDRQHTMMGVTVIVADLGATGVWHIALFLIASELHGRGVAHAILGALEAWMSQSGAKWLRLGVVDGNSKAEPFWARHGFHQVRLRAGVDTAGRVNHIRVLLKPILGDPIADYLKLVPRDHPDSNLP